MNNTYREHGTEYENEAINNDFYLRSNFTISISQMIFFIDALISPKSKFPHDKTKKKMCVIAIHKLKLSNDTIENRVSKQVS